MFAPDPSKQSRFYFISQPINGNSQRKSMTNFTHFGTFKSAVSQIARKIINCHTYARIGEIRLAAAKTLWPAALKNIAAASLAAASGRWPISTQVARISGLSFA